MPEGLNRTGNFREGSPVTLPHDFGNDVASGKIFRMATKESCILGGQTASPIRFHVNRVIINSAYHLCREV